MARLAVVVVHGHRGRPRVLEGGRGPRVARPLLGGERERVRTVPGERVGVLAGRISVGARGRVGGRFAHHRMLGPGERDRVCAERQRRERAGDEERRDREHQPEGNQPPARRSEFHRAILRRRSAAAKGVQPKIFTVAPVDELDLLTGSAHVAEPMRGAKGDRTPTAWEVWRRERERLFREHPQSPVPRRTSGLHGAARVRLRPGLAAVGRGGVRGREELRPALERRWDDDHEALRGRTRRERRARAVLARRLRRRPVRAIRGRDERRRDLRRRPLRPRHRQGRRPRLERRAPRLDLNFAYQPSCSYDPRWTCPLAPPANRLDMPVRAGERLGRTA